jgi:hypothetical protein
MVDSGRLIATGGLRTTSECLCVLFVRFEIEPFVSSSSIVRWLAIVIFFLSVGVYWGVRLGLNSKGVEACLGMDFSHSVLKSSVNWLDPVNSKRSWPEKRMYPLDPKLNTNWRWPKLPNEKLLTRRSISRISESLGDTPNIWCKHRTFCY